MEKKESKMKIGLTGGKTGGHIYPAVAIADIFKGFKGTEIFYVGDQQGLEKSITADHSILFYGLDFGPLVGVSLGGKIKNMLKNIKSFFKSLGIIGREKPTLMIGTGGFVCGPVLMASFIKRVPFIIHEQNVQPGLTNRLLSRLAKEVWLTFPESSENFPKKTNKVLTGMPLRKSFESRELEKTATKDKTPVLLVVGGSQGSRFLNNRIKKEYKKIINLLNYKIIHVTGPALEEEVLLSLDQEEQMLVSEGKLIIKNYIEEMDEALKNTDVVVGRAGAGFVCEIATLDKKAILVPLKSAAANHQFKNAKVLEKSGQALVIEEDDFHDDSFYLALLTLQAKDNHNIIIKKSSILSGKTTEDIIKKEVERILGSKK